MRGIAGQGQGGPGDREMVRTMAMDDRTRNSRYGVSFEDGALGIYRLSDR